MHNRSFEIGRLRVEKWQQCSKLSRPCEQSQGHWRLHSDGPRMSECVCLLDCLVQTNCHRLDALFNGEEHTSSHSRDLRSRIQMPSGLISPRSFSLGCRWHLFCLLDSCAHGETCGSICSYKFTSSALKAKHPTLMVIFNPSCFFEELYF